ncbi:hypothetical protein O181_035811 [Austropuccinia psidii MF-1]|uniref:Uncharacterized protein n=1 Tax=Austropuccinia psidii MF-1 TaxID=1389203 RepID=A0A9Q3D3A3_9BASI|nr:hypothetical protein [Austropuccinia psidii MF-1]
MASWPYHPSTGHILPALALLGNSPPHQPPGHYPCLWAWGPPTASTAHEAPFGPNPMMSKRAKGLVHQPSRPGGPTLANIGPKIGQISAHGLPKPPEATSSAPIKDSPQLQGEDFSFLNSPHTQASRSGA